MLPDYYRKFIETMQERLPGGANLANILMEILELGKESVYRRLRGDVAFTFDEVVYLSKHFNISLDSIFGERVSNGAMFNMQFLRSNSEMQNYEDLVNYYSNIFGYIAKDPQSELSLASNMLPLVSYSSYDALTRYRIYRWMYQNSKLTYPGTLSDSEFPVSVMNMQRKLTSDIQNIGNVLYIWDANVIVSLVKEILYFAGLRLISYDDVEILKGELLCLLDELEGLTVKGRFDNGHPVSIYLSDLNFDMSYGYAEREGFQISFFRAYSTNSVDSQQKSICEEHKRWINLLKQHSTLITQSGEAEKIRFFNEQRRIVKDMSVLKPTVPDVY